MARIDENELKKEKQSLLNARDRGSLDSEMERIEARLRELAILEGQLRSMNSGRDSISARRLLVGVAELKTRLNAEKKVCALRIKAAGAMKMDAAHALNYKEKEALLAYRKDAEKILSPIQSQSYRKKYRRGLFGSVLDGRGVKVFRYAGAEVELIKSFLREADPSRTYSGAGAFSGQDMERLLEAQEKINVALSKKKRGNVDAPKINK